MAWRGDKYYYGIRELREIAGNYNDIADAEDRAIIEKKVDFDRAVNNLGKGHWTGWKKDIKPFHQCNSYCKLQKMIIADIIGMSGYELHRWGFYRVPQYRRVAYFEMQRFLNGG